MPRKLGAARGSVIVRKLISRAPYQRDKFRPSPGFLPPAKHDGAPRSRDDPRTSLRCQHLEGPRSQQLTGCVNREGVNTQGYLGDSAMVNTLTTRYVAQLFHTMGCMMKEWFDLIPSVNCPVNIMSHNTFYVDAI